MNARVETGLSFVFVAAIASVAACTSGPSEERRPAPTVNPPGTPTPGGAQRDAECIGPSTLDTAAREKLADEVCSGDTGRKAHRSAARSTCADAYAVRSDGQITAMIASYGDDLARASASAEKEASDPAVRDLAHLLHVGATRLHEGQTHPMGRTMKSEETAASRAFGRALRTELEAVPRGAGFDREYVARQVEQQHRALMMIDALAGQTRDADTRCEIDSARIMTETNLDQACWVWSGMGHVSGGRTSGRGRGGRSTMPGQGAIPGRETMPRQGPIPGQETNPPQGSSPPRCVDGGAIEDVGTAAESAGEAAPESGEQP